MGFKPINAEPQENSGGRFKPLTTPVENVYREKTMETLQSPSGLSGKEIEFLDDVQNKGSSNGSFFGFENIGDGVGQLLRGSGGVFGSTPQVVGSEMIRNAEAFNEVYGTELSAKDFLNVLNPFKDNKVGAGAGSIAKIQNALGFDGEENFEFNQKTLERGRALIKSNEDFLERNNLTKQKDDGILFDIGSGFANVGTSVGLSFLTKNASYATVLFAALQRSDIYMEARDSGMSPEMSRKVSNLAGFVEGVIEAYGGRIFLEASGKLITKIFKRSLNEGFQEGTQTGAEETITQISGIRDVDIEQAVKNVGYSAMLGVIVGAPITGFATIVEQRALDNGMSEEQALSVKQSIIENEDQVREQMSEMIGDQTSPYRVDDTGEAASVEAFRKLQSGEEIEITPDMEAEVEAMQSFVEQGEMQIDAQTGANILPVPKRPKTLSKFLKEKGGLKIDTGEARRFTRKESPALGGVASKNGKLSLDEARALAVEGGFLKENEVDVAITTEQDLIDLLEQEAMGADVVSDLDMPELQNREQIIEYNNQQEVANQELLQDIKEVRSFKAAYRKGVKNARKDVKAAQEAVIKILDKVKLDPNDKAKFIKTIKNIQTQQQFEKQVDKIADRVELLLKDKSFNKQKKKLLNSLKPKAIKPSLQSGRKKGKFTADIQSQLESLSRITKMTKDEAYEKFRSNINNNSENVLETKLANVIAKGSNATIEEVAEVNAEVSALKATGRSISQAKMDARKAEAEAYRKEIREHLNKKGNLSTERIKNKKVKNAVSWFIDSYSDFIGKIMPKSIRDDFDLGEDISNRKRILAGMQQRFIQIGQEVYGKDPKALGKLLGSDHKIEKLGLFEDANGEVISLDVSIAQARKTWMNYQNEKVRKRMMGKNGNAYTQEMFDAMFGLLTDQDKMFATKQIEMYEEFYDIVNPVYKDIYGVNLGKVKYYSPIRAEYIGKIDDNLNDFMEQIHFSNEVSSNVSTKMRDSKATSAIEMQSDVSVFNTYSMGMSRFTALGQKTRLLNDVFRDPKLAKNIKRRYGSDFNKNWHSMLEMIAQGMKSHKSPLDNIFNYMNRNFATGVLGGKAKIGLTQTSSYFAYAEYVGDQKSKAMIKSALNFASNPRHVVRTLSKSQLMIDRGANLDVDIARIGKAFDKKTIKKLQDGKASVIDMTLIFTKLGDRGTIYFGGWAVYQHVLEKTGSEQKAMAAFEKATAETQQSKDIDRVSLMQGSSALGRSLSMFQTAPFAQFRGEMRGIRQYKDGEIDAAELGKRLMIYHVLIPQMYKLLSNGILFGEFDLEDQLWTLILGSLNAIPILSEGINMGVRRAQGKSTFNPTFIKWGKTFGEGIISGVDLIASGVEGDFASALEEGGQLSLAIGQMLGAPVPAGKQIVDGIIDISDDNVKQGSMKIFGYPDSVAEGSDGKGKKKKRSDDFRTRL